MTGVVLAGGMVAALMAQPQAALAACQGVNTANVLCDAANQATGGTLMTTFPGTTTVDVNAGGRINTGGAAATVTAPGSLTFNNNDTTFGIVNTGGTGVTLTNNFGAITYTGIGTVTGSGTGSGILATSSGLGAITVTTGGTITGGTSGASSDAVRIRSTNGANTSDITVHANAAMSANWTGIEVTKFGRENVLVDGAGTIHGTNFGIQVGAANTSTAGNVTVTGTGDTTQSGARGGDAILVILNAGNRGNILVDRSGAISGDGGIDARTQGSGSVTVNVSNNVTGRLPIGAGSVDGPTTVNIYGGVITSTSNAVSAFSSGSGIVTINVIGGDIHGGDRGIIAQASGTGGINIYIAPGRTVSSTSSTIEAGSGNPAVNNAAVNIVDLGTISSTDMAATFTGTLTVGNGGTTGTIIGSVADNGTLRFNRSDSVTFGGQISGTGSFQQMGPGTTILTANNTYAGGTIISGGTLAVSADANLGAPAGSLSFDGGTLRYLAGFDIARTTILNAGGGTVDTNGFSSTLSGRWGETAD